MLSRILRALEGSKYRTQVKILAEACFSTAGTVLQRVPGGERCPVCNARLVCLFRPVMSDDLTREWGLDQKWRSFCDEREGQICLSCGGSLRVRHLAAALARWLRTRGGRASSVAAARRECFLPGLHVAEINSCGALHKMLARLPHIAYSEYLPDNAAVRHEDMVCLTYPDGAFDLVLHSETLEHTPDVDRALAEIRRVLKPGGTSIFTVPIIRDGRPTVVRAETRDGGTRHILPPTYHGGSYQATRQYLVYYEFGDDFVSRVVQAGFEVTLDEHPTNPAVVTFVARKPQFVGGGSTPN